MAGRYEFLQDSISLSLSNPYYDGRLYALGNELELVREPVVWEGDNGDRWHTVLNSDTLERIADRYYEGLVENPAFYWWVIGDANGIENPIDLSGLKGQEIIVPNITRFLVIRQQQ